MAAMEWKDQYDDCDEPGGDDDENDNDNPKPDWANGSSKDLQPQPPSL